MRLTLLPVVTLLAAAPLGCSAGTVTGAATTSGIEGVVLRGPVTPVCVAGRPCYAGFAATFSVEQGGRSVATFESDSAGRFAVRIRPGTYVVVPAAGAPITRPTAQTRTVEVAPGPLTKVQLTFDTGIR